MLWLVKVPVNSISSEGSVRPWTRPSLVHTHFYCVKNSNLDILLNISFCILGEREINYRKRLKFITARQLWIKVYCISLLEWDLYVCVSVLYSPAVWGCWRQGVCLAIGIVDNWPLVQSVCFQLHTEKRHDGTVTLLRMPKPLRACMCVFLGWVGIAECIWRGNTDDISAFRNA